MSGLDSLLQLILLGLLGLTLWHAIRLERALRALRRDRVALNAAVSGLDGSARTAEAGMSHLHQLAQRAAEDVTGAVQAATTLRDDLAFLTARGDTLADRLEALVRASRPAVAAQTPSPTQPADPSERGRSKAERDLMQAMRGA